MSTTGNVQISLHTNKHDEFRKRLTSGCIARNTGRSMRVIWLYNIHTSNLLQQYRQDFLYTSYTAALPNM